MNKLDIDLIDWKRKEKTKLLQYRN